MSPEKATTASGAPGVALASTTIDFSPALTRTDCVPAVSPSVQVTMTWPVAPVVSVVGSTVPEPSDGEKTIGVPSIGMPLAS